jgi:hypothetical protein
MVASSWSVEVEYTELTADDQLRRTTFLGWRGDKKPKEVVLERYQTTWLFDAVNGTTLLSFQTGWRISGVKPKVRRTANLQV